MTGGQRTFVQIPTSLVRSNGQQRPMTSKAAKKAYQQANRGPRISRVEQHRRDKAELEQQKREYEREKAAEKAKAAREKKAAKAAADKEARRKQGLPEPSKFVRASQPTISRFVRTNSTNKRTWQQMDSVAEDSDKTISDAERDDEAPPAKRRAVDDGSDNEFGDFPSLSQSDLLEQIDSSILSAKDGTSAPGSLKKMRLSSQPRRREASQELPIMKDVDEHAILNTQALDEMATTQLLSDLAEAVAKSDSMEPPNINPSQLRKETSEVTPKVPVSPRRSGRVADREGKAVSVSTRRKPDIVPVVEIPYKTVVATRPQIKGSPRNNRPKAQAPVSTLQGRSVNMPPPRLPTKVMAATKSISTPQRSSFPSRNPTNHAPKTLPNLLPSSTQAFLENHLDEFFPSPTQAVRELLDDVDDIPSNTEVARELSQKMAEKDIFDDMFCTQDLIMSPEDLVVFISPHGTPAKPLDEATSEPLNRRESTHIGRELSPEKTEKDILDDMFCTQGLILSPDDLVGIISPHRTPPKPPVEPTSESLNRRDNTQVARGLSSGKAENDILDTMFCTQDLILSPEDLVEICSPVRAPPRHLPEARSTSPNSRVTRPACRQKQRFFQEKEQDLYHAAIHESKAQGNNIQTNDPTSLGRNQSDSTDYGEFDFDLPGLFKEKEDEELEAAIRESKITAELEAKRLALAGMPDLNRIQSNSTDYGDFDLPRLFDEQDEDLDSRGADVAAQVPKQSEEVMENSGKGKPRRFFEEKYEDQVHAAIHESKMLAAKKVPAREGTGTEKPKRTLKRVLSTATDYGDDDFTGCSQELLDLC